MAFCITFGTHGTYAKFAAEVESARTGIRLMVGECRIHESARRLRGRDGAVS